jgi:hypothetical protein
MLNSTLTTHEGQDPQLPAMLHTTHASLRLMFQHHMPIIESVPDKRGGSGVRMVHVLVSSFAPHHT